MNLPRLVHLGIAPKLCYLPLNLNSWARHEYR